MRILFDQGTPVPLRNYLAGHQVVTAYERGWSDLQNGQLLHSAEEDNFEVVITTDQNLRYQQNLAERRLAIVVLLSTNWPLIQSQVVSVVSALNSLAPCDYIEIYFPPKTKESNP